MSAAPEAVRAVVIPSETFAAYDRAGITYVRDYYNPQGAFDEVHVVSPLEKEAVARDGVQIHPVKNGTEFRQKVREIQPDVIRAYGGFWAADFALTNRVDETPVMVSVHDVKMVHPSVRYADLVICMSEAVRRVVIKRGTDPARIRMLPNRVDQEVFKPASDGERAALRAEFAEKYRPGRMPGRMLVHVGRKTRQKNLETVITALRELPEDVYVVFIGRGHDHRYRKLAEKLGVSARCFWEESIDNKDLPRYFNGCHAMCTPSRWEGFGIVFIEAAACGALIITSNIAPMNEFLTTDESAVLVDAYEDPEALTAAVTRVLDEPDLHGRLAQGAIKMAERFSKQAVDAREVEIYQEAMKLKGHRYSAYENFVLSFHVVLRKIFSGCKQVMIFVRDLFR